jgi:hypothetical protein
VAAALPEDLAAIERELDVATADARAVTEGLSDAQAAWSPAPGAWGVGDCIDHLAQINGVYVESLREAMTRAREAGRTRRGPGAPGAFGRWFVGQMEPPVGAPMKAPKKGRPPGRPLSVCWPVFLDVQEQVRAAIHDAAALDVNARFKNPFVPMLRFRIFAGFQVITAHERRHLWQAWKVRKALPTA